MGSRCLVFPGNFAFPHVSFRFDCVFPANFWGRRMVFSMNTEVTMPHTVQAYSLLDPAPTYGNSNFSDLGVWAKRWKLHMGYSKMSLKDIHICFDHARKMYEYVNMLVYSGWILQQCKIFKISIFALTTQGICEHFGIGWILTLQFQETGHLSYCSRAGQWCSTLKLGLLKTRWPLTILP